MPVPCDCCPTGPPRCALIAERFDTVAETASQAGWNQTNLAGTIDGITNTTALSGYTTGGATIPSTTLRVTYTVTPQDRVRGLRLWNQAGSDLGDADGLGQFVAEFYSGVTLLSTQTYVGVNGGQVQSFFLPNAQELNGVDSVVLRNIGTQGNVNGVKPLWRELQLIRQDTVFPCRRRSGALEWYDENGVLVPSTDIVPCDPIPVFPVPNLVMTGGAFGDDPSGTAENVCAVVPAPLSTTGWAAPVDGCYDPVTGAPTMTWGPVASVELEYSNGPGGQASGGVFMSFSSPTGGGSITWPTNLTNMQPGEQRMSNVFGNGRRARITLLSVGTPTGPSVNGSVRMNGGAVLGVHILNVSAAGNPIRFRLDFTTA